MPPGPSSADIIFVDPLGDTEACTSTSIFVLVSSKVLSSASPAFVPLLLPPSTDGRRTLFLLNDYEPAVILLMRILHSQAADVPATVPVLLLARLAGLCRKYSCCSAVSGWASLALAQNWEHPTGALGGSDLQTRLEWMEVAYTFGYEDVFAWASNGLAYLAQWDQFDIKDTPDANEAERRIFLGNLPSCTTEDDLRRLFAEIHLNEVHIPLQDPVRYGFVSLTSFTDLNRALNRAKKAVLWGKRISAELVRPSFNPIKPDKGKYHGSCQHKNDPIRSLFVGNISLQTTSSELRAVFRDIPLESISFPAQAYNRYAFVRVENRCDVRRAIQESNGKLVRGVAIRVEASACPCLSILEKPFPTEILKEQILLRRSSLISLVLPLVNHFLLKIMSKIAVSKPCLIYSDRSTTSDAGQAAFCESLVLGRIIVALGDAGTLPLPITPYPGLTVMKLLLGISNAVLDHENDHKPCQEAIEKRMAVLVEQVLAAVLAFKGLSLEEIRTLEATANESKLKDTC